jgi:hypothetical protein
MSRTDEEKAEGLDQKDDITSSIRVKESGGSRVCPNDARGRRQPQSGMACGYIELDTDIAVLLNDPNSKDLETKRPMKTRHRSRRITLVYKEHSVLSKFLHQYAQDIAFFSCSPLCHKYYL